MPRLVPPIFFAAVHALDGCGSSSQTGPSASSAGACGQAVDITPGGSFQGDTCEAGVPLELAGCADAGKASVFVLKPDSHNWNRIFNATDGFAIMESGHECAFEVPSCGAGSITGAALPAGTYTYLAVARPDGQCGPFTLDVYNASGCLDRADASTCACGNIPACPTGQICYLGGTPPTLTGSCIPDTYPE
jgi:hypothetical protein